MHSATTTVRILSSRLAALVRPFTGTRHVIACAIATMLGLLGILGAFSLLVEFGSLHRRSPGLPAVE